MWVKNKNMVASGYLLVDWKICPRGVHIYIENLELLLLSDGWNRGCCHNDLLKPKTLGVTFKKIVHCCSAIGV